MIRLGTIRELFTYFDWANAKTLGLSADLTDAQLDRPFEMGEGSLRATLYHIWGSQRLWLDRWHGRPHVPAGGPAGFSIEELRRRGADAVAERNDFLVRHTDESLQQAITYTNIKGETFTRKLADMLLHVTNHGIHHRAQAVNMLRRLGAALPQPGVDYIFMRLSEKALPPPQLDQGSLAAYFAYGDWANAQVHTAAEKLSDEQLERRFEIGLGSLRDTLIHIRDGEQWWLDNWLHGPEHLFPKTAEKISVAELRANFASVAQARNEFLRSRADADLSRNVEAQPRPGVTRSFPLGVTMLQLCCHGTHHRAQALNMLRHVGGPVPALDYVVWLRSAGAPS